MKVIDYESIFKLLIGTNSSGLSQQVKNELGKHGLYLRSIILLNWKEWDRFLIILQKIKSLEFWAEAGKDIPQHINESELSPDSCLWKRTIFDFTEAEYGPPPKWFKELYSKILK